MDLCGGTHFLNYVDDIGIWHHLWSTLAKHLKQDDYNRLFCNKKEEQDETLATLLMDPGTLGMVLEVPWINGLSEVFFLSFFALFFSEFHDVSAARFTSKNHQSWQKY